MALSQVLMFETIEQREKSTWNKVSEERVCFPHEILHKEERTAIEQVEQRRGPPETYNCAGGITRTTLHRNLPYALNPSASQSRLM